MAIDFIKENRKDPFFLYLPWSIPHAPLQDPALDPSTAFDAGPKSNTPEGREVYVKMVEHLDSRIGKIFKTLKKEGQLDNTLIIFTSDNGGMLSGNCWPLKKSKQHLEEGGIRVPCLMQWPARIPAGTLSQQSSIMMDASVTVLEASGALTFVPKGRKLDGVNLLPFLTNQAEVDPVSRSFGWRRRDWGAGGNYLRQEAFRSGDWKLLRTFKYLRNKKWSAEHEDELFNLSDDLGETENLSEKKPAKIPGNEKELQPMEVRSGEPGTGFLHSVCAINSVPQPTYRTISYSRIQLQNLRAEKYTRERHAELVSDPVNENGVCIVTVKAGATPPLLHSTMKVDTKKYSKMKFEMKILKGTKVGAGRAVLRHTIWKGDDILFQPIADGQWHEYIIDCTKSDAWSQWSSSGRIGIALPVPAKGEIKIALKTITLGK